MDKFLIRGGRRLVGKVAAVNAKNAVLPVLAACLLTEEPCTIRAVPLLEDVNTMVKLLRSMGVRVEQPGRHETTWNLTDKHGRRVAAGVYLVSIDSPGGTHRAKAVVGR
jgi:UDP-N-acetylglucosamine enolpyruvyl transferase